MIEVSPQNFGIYEVENSNQLICSNHFQSAAYADDKKNQNHIFESHSQYRYERMEELLSETPKVTPKSAVDILRNREGLEDEKIGYGNEKALNQLLAHHGIVFQPEDLKVWVSSNPYQLGAFVAYDLNEVFDISESGFSQQSLMTKTEVIQKDPFVNTLAYQHYERYRKLSSEIKKAINKEEKIADTKLSSLIALNPDFWEAYYIVGRYYQERGYLRLAEEWYKKALTKEITTVPDRENIEKRLKKIRRSLQ